MEKLRSISCLLMVLVILGSFAPFASAAQFSGGSAAGFTGGSSGTITNTYQSSRPTFDSFYGSSFDTYWPILNSLENDECDSARNDFIIGIPPGGCSPTVVRSDLLAEQNVPVFCQLSAIRVNPLIDVSTIKSISFKQKNQSDLIAGISFHPARAAVKSYKTLLGSPVDENIGYVVVVLKQQANESNLEEQISGMLTATVNYDSQGSFGTGAAEYYLEPIADERWESKAAENSFWAGKGYLRVRSVDEDEATIEVLTSKDDVYRTVTLKEGATSDSIYYPGQYCTAAMKLKLNKIDNSEDMARINIDGDTFWVREGSKLLGGKCSVRNLNVFPAGSGSVEISCSGNDRFTLVLGGSGVVLNNGTKNISVGIGGSVNAGKEDIYLGYYGKNDFGKFVILFDKSLAQDDVSKITGIFDIENFDSEDKMNVALNTISKLEGHYKIMKEGEKWKGVTVSPIGFDGASGKYPESSFIPKYLDLSEQVALDLVDLFPAEKTESGVYWGEETLKNQIELAVLAKDEERQSDLIKEFLSEYPSSGRVEYMRDLKLNLDMFDHSGSSANVFVNNKDYNIRADGFVSGSGASDSVTLRFGGGTTHTLKRDKVFDVSNNFEEITDEKKQKDTVPRLIINDIDGSSVKLSYVWKDTERDKTTTSSETIDVGGSSSVGGVRVSIVDTNVREVAYVSLIPEIKNTKTEANFTFNIGIEKRAIELSPEKAQKKVDGLNKSIADWEARIEKLGNLLKGMKAACLATSTVLTLKSMVSGFSGGASIARGKVMDIYEEKCEKEHAGIDLQECYSLHYKDDIDKSIKSYGDSVVAVNEKVKKCTSESESISTGFFESKVVDGETYVKELKDCNVISSDWSETIDGVTFNRGHLNDASDIRAVLLKQEACSRGDTVACDMAKKEMKEALADNVDGIKISKKSEEILGIAGVDVPASVHPNSKAVTQRAVSAKGNNLTGVNESNYLARVRKPKNSNEEYLVELDKDSKIINVYKINGNPVTDEETKKTIADKNKFIIPSGKESSCSNTIANPFVRYYESGNKQGFAAIVPVDKDDGWYAHIENKDYDDSGMPKAFSICNVGTGGKMGTGANGGDTCQLFQISSAGDVSTFIPCPRMSSSEVKRLYQKTESMIRDANRNGNGVNLDGEFIHKTTPIGPSSTDLECTDFMSVDDCNLMFNVCDPVICPTSRCDMGGTFPVSNVVSSGIIGSIALCLPNFGNPAEGGVIIPVCLSGLHAGLESYVSILKSYKGCLEENIESGTYTGICDEITAIYTCEFFWGQISPVLDSLLSRVVEKLYGGLQVKGGAEYLTIQKSFENLDNTVNYFANDYMESSTKAFNLKNTEEIGGTICKGFVGSSIPTSIDSLDSLLEPESPPQFYAYFSDSLFSEATVPSTSHYKVYYHIYAGKDSGAQYRVYLKNPPESSYYASRETMLVDSGYVAKGVPADESIDFTAPTGYKELCVSINGVDECGFGSVTSDFGLNYASQAYVADQADDKQIESTEECVTTSASAWGLANPNLQAGVEKSIGQDDIATTGIVRICASTNPDQGVVGGNDVYCNPGTPENNSKCAYGYSCISVDAEAESKVGICKNTKTKDSQISQGKWVDVGSCDGDNMKCWLDTTTVKENLDQYMAVNNLSVSQLVRDSEDLTELKEQYKNVKEKISVLKQESDKLIGSLIDEDGNLVSDAQDIIDGLDEVSGADDNIGQGSNAAKAEAMSIKASIYRGIVENLVAKHTKKAINGGLKKPAEDEENKPGVATPSNIVADPSSNSIYFFKGSEYWKFNVAENKFQHTLDISQGWDDLQVNSLDAAAADPLSNSIFLFEGSEYWKFDMTTDKFERGYPKKISDEGKGIPDSLDAAVADPSSNSIYFFQGNDYWKFNVAENKVVDGYPLRISDEWKGVPSNRLDAAVADPSWE